MRLVCQKSHEHSHVRAESKHHGVHLHAAQGQDEDEEASKDTSHGEGDSLGKGCEQEDGDGRNQEEPANQADERSTEGLDAVGQQVRARVAFVLRTVSVLHGPLENSLQRYR